MEAFDWQVPASPARAAVLNAITTRGFTGHEHADRLGIIQMGGRIYDPTLGRFLQADPFVQAPKNSQNLNRYSYVLNNPLSYTDPSGYFFESLMKNWGRLIAKYYRVIFAAAISYATFGVASAAGWGLAASGAAAGAAGGAVLTGTLEGAFYGGLLGYSLGAGAGAEQVFAEYLGEAAYYRDMLQKLWDGRAGHDFMAAGTGNWSRLGTGAAPLTTEYMQAASVAGTVSVQTDRKFGNGADRNLPYGVDFVNLNRVPDVWDAADEPRRFVDQRKIDSGSRIVFTQFENIFPRKANRRSVLEEALASTVLKAYQVEFEVVELNEVTKTRVYDYYNDVDGKRRFASGVLIHRREIGVVIKVLSARRDGLGSLLVDPSARIVPQFCVEAEFLIGEVGHPCDFLK